jgi:polyketide biosynthesis enoyl-CoA hydratase PksI
VPFPVLPRNEVYPHALDLARSLAEKPRIALTELKAQLVAPLREQLPLAVKREQAMHARTFHQPEVRENIETKFGGAS